MPKITKDNVWVKVGIRWGFWLILKDRAEKNDTSVQKEMEKILTEELKEMVKKQ
jgi:hypothetical protein